MALGVIVIDGKLLLCHGNSEQSKENPISMIEYKYRTLHECFNNNFPIDGVIPSLNIPPIAIDYSSHRNERSRYTSDPLPAAIYVTSGKSIIALTTPS